jgi:hypothetical protein
MDNKETGVAVISQADIEATNANMSVEKKGTADDQRDMFRMGKHQQLRVGDLHSPGGTVAHEPSATFDSSVYSDSR